MEWLTGFLDFFIHLDHHLLEITDHYGTWTYALLFLIIFCETGLVVTPFLPGDSLLFAVGALAAAGVLKVSVVMLLLIPAAVLGDAVNYWIGHILAPKVFGHEKIPFLKQEHLERTQKFYEKYGSKTIILARFLPIIRTFAPFLAGVGKMRYLTFSIYNITGGILWISLFIFGGYFFGNMPLVKENFSLVILGIIIVSILPAVIEIVRHKLSTRSSSASGGR